MLTPDISAHHLGVVVIGRNEGERLLRCLDSLQGANQVVYVDSGSTDGSADRARERGADVVDLDLSIPFTAARARNAGLRRLLERQPEIPLVQFVDGDCEVDAHWFAKATQFLSERPEVVVVCGRRRERFPEASPYNLLCDLEWNTPIGEAGACGGDSLMRVSAVMAVGGFRDDAIAGEEPELCVRLRMAGGKIWRIDAEMTRHDAAITRISQWWRRNVRTGYGFAQVAAIHAKNPLGIWKKDVRSNWFWGLIVPTMAVVAAPFTWGISLVLFLGYAVLFWKIARYRRRLGDAPRVARLYARYCVLAKFPQVLGQMKRARDRLFGRRAKIIEYKGPETTG